MKNISIYLNIVLFVLVIILYVDRFAGGNDSENTNTNTESTANGLNVVYVNIDSLLDGYDLYNELSTQLMKKRNDLETNLASKSKSLERKALELQQKYEKRLITPTRAQEMQQNLMSEQQNLLAWKEQKSLELMEDEQNINRQVYDSIINFLKEYNADNRYNLIISNSLGGNLLYGDKNLNITDTVLTSLNKKYIGSTNNAKTNPTEENKEKEENN